jgi:hypothetical protein
MVRGVVSIALLVIYVLKSEFDVMCWCWLVECKGCACVANYAARCIMMEERNNFNHLSEYADEWKTRMGVEALVLELFVNIGEPLTWISCVVCLVLP